MRLHLHRAALALTLGILAATTNAESAGTPTGPFGLDLPDDAVSDRVSITRGIGANRRETWAELDGPGCINHIWITLKHPKHSEMANRKIVLRIYFDGAEVPHVETPVGDFFGAMHGQDWYDVNNEFLSVKAWSGYNSYFRMPFAKSARIEFETGPEAGHVYLQVDWHRYPGRQLDEPRRFCARWRRENPTQRYGEDYFMLDADGPGQLVGFVYGVRLIDDVDRWSHGGSENVYLDGDGDHPAYLRGIGGEDTFGTSYGGAQHPPETHLYAAMPYYVHEDVGEARPAQRLVGYRFFVKDAVRFSRSIHVRFGCMQNDVCSTVYWYQTGPVRPFVKMPEFANLLPGTPLARGEMDEPLPEAGTWWLKGPLENKAGEAIRDGLAASGDDGRQLDPEGWTKRASHHGFVDFGHVFRPEVRGVGVHYTDKAAVARCVLEAEREMTARLRLAWDDRLVLQVGAAAPLDLGDHAAFRQKTVQVPLAKGRNQVKIALSNTRGSNHGGWAFAFKATAPDGGVLLPKAE